MDKRSSMALARIVDMLLDEVPEAAAQAEAFSRRIEPVLLVCFTSMNGRSLLLIHKGSWGHSWTACRPDTTALQTMVTISMMQPAGAAVAPSA